MLELKACTPITFLFSGCWELNPGLLGRVNSSVFLNSEPSLQPQVGLLRIVCNFWGLFIWSGLPSRLLYLRRPPSWKSASLPVSHTGFMPKSRFTGRVLSVMNAVDVLFVEIESPMTQASLELAM